MQKKIYRSVSDRKISGVCGGLAEYLNVDATVIRIIWAIISLFTLFAGIAAYLICTLLIPEKPDNSIIDAE